MIGGSEHLDEHDRAFLETLVPSDAMDPQLIAIASWLEPDTGEQKWTYYAPDETLLSHKVGMLEMVKQALIRHVIKAMDDDDE